MALSTAMRGSNEADGTESAGSGASSAGVAPVIEIATYAETDVYECYIRGFESRIVMRRTADDWVNITQVFKIAQFSKTQRTKVLEKESNDMRHEKVQGGYGRFQGTWIPLENAKYMVSKYNIRDPVVSTIIGFQFDPHNPPVKRSKNSVLKRSSPNGRITSPSSYNKTPKKKQFGSSAMARKTKKNAGLLQPNPSPLQNLVFQTPQQAHLTAQNANTTVSQAANDKETPMTMGYSATQKPLQFYPVPTSLSHPQKIPRNNHHSNANFHNGTDSQSFLTFIPEGPNQGVFSTQDQAHQSVPNITVNGSMKHPPKKRRADSNVDPAMKDDAFLNQDKTQQNFKMMKQQMWQNIHPKHLPQTSPKTMYPVATSNTTHSNTSSMEMFSTQDNPTPMSSRSSTPQPFSGIPTAPATAVENDDLVHAELEQMSVEEYKETILQVLSSEDGSDKDYALPSQMYHPPSSLDINFEIDDQGHTPLHWATAMANIPLIKLLIALNGNVLQSNSKGFNCITKSIFYNNCFKAGSFPEIVSLLRICLVTPDSNGRLPLHYLVELSVNKSKDPVVINSYMDSIIQNLGQDDYTLLRMSLNFQDNLGNTVLHLAALNLNLELCNKLCYLGSSMDITNYDNETPASILAKFNLVPPTTVNQTFSPQAVNKGSLYFEQPTTMLANPAKTTPKVPQEKDHHGLSPNDDEPLIKAPQIKLTPAVPTRKMAGRNYLAGADSTTFNSLMDDLSNIDSFVTSSAIRDVKTTPSKLLESSPILKKKRPSTTSMLPPSSMKKFTTLSEAMESPLGPIMASPRAGAPRVKELGDVVSLAGKLKDISNNLVFSLTTQATSIATEIDSTQKGIATVKKNMERVEQGEKEIIAQYDPSAKIESIDDLGKATEELRHTTESGKVAYIQCIEKSQALSLASLVQEEESKVDEEASASPAPGTAQTEDSWKLATELAFLQFRRRSCLTKIIDKKCNVNTSNKINKYRRLIGMTVENIETKLDEIETDLRANA